MGKPENVFRSDRLLAIQGKRTQQEFAIYLGVNQSQLQKYLTGRSEPTAAIVARMASKAGVSTDWLLGLSDNRHEQVKLLSSNLILLLNTLPQHELDRIERLINAMLPPDSGNDST